MPRFVFAACLSALITGCVQQSSQAANWRFVSLSQLVLASEEYNGDYLGVSGVLMRGDYLFFESNELLDKMPTTIVVQLAYQNPKSPQPSEDSTDCEGEFVRVFGRFARISSHLGYLGDVRKIVKLKNRVPGKDDVVCWPIPIEISG